ncbi:MAG: hypothetical protein K2J62_01375 [Bacteroidales bacterium]|nr:hypothetical protein [Bacteroidales bacterium]
MGKLLFVKITMIISLMGIPWMELDARKKEKVSKDDNAVKITLYLNADAPVQGGQEV